MASDFRPSGLFPPLVTPFTEDDRVDLGSLERLAAQGIDDGAAGGGAPATPGGGAAPRAAPPRGAAGRDAVVAACAAVCADKGAMLIVGAGTNDTSETIRRHE